MSVEQVPGYEREVVMAHLERERELWLPHYQDAKVGKPDAQTRADYFMNRIDSLLLELVEIDTQP
jgi:hypothetical protein